MASVESVLFFMYLELRILYSMEALVGTRDSYLFIYYVNKLEVTYEA